jgi:hypothetical protein
LRSALGKQVGDTVEVHLRERLSRSSPTATTSDQSTAVDVRAVAVAAAGAVVVSTAWYTALGRQLAQLNGLRRRRSTGDLGAARRTNPQRHGGHRSRRAGPAQRHPRPRRRSAARPRALAGLPGGPCSPAPSYTRRCRGGSPPSTAVIGSEARARQRRRHQAQALSSRPRTSSAWPPVWENALPPLIPCPSAWQARRGAGWGALW